MSPPAKIIANMLDYLHMGNYRGVIIEESLENKDILKKVKIASTRVEKVTDQHRTPWLKQWTLHKVEIPENEARAIAEEISRSLDTSHNNWYADYKNETHHYIIYPSKVFKVERGSKEQYEEAERYGVSLGIPQYQLINYKGEYKDAA